MKDEQTGWDALLDSQDALYAFMQVELDAMHPQVKGMLPFRTTFKPLSKNVALQFTRDIGPTSPEFKEAIKSEAQARQLILRMLAMTQIDFSKFQKGDRPFRWHADLRPANVNAYGHVIDFEFLGRKCRRGNWSKTNPEITNEQTDGHAPTERTAAWQIAMLVARIFLKKGSEIALDIRAAAEKKQKYEYSGTCWLRELTPQTLVNDVKNLLEALACYEVLEGNNADYAIEKLKEQYAKFAAYEFPAQHQAPNYSEY